MVKKGQDQHASEVLGTRGGVGGGLQASYANTYMFAYCKKWF